MVRFSMRIAMVCRGLPITELEAMTLGFAMLNSIMYTLRWDKPQNIRIPIYLNARRAGDKVNVVLSVSDYCTDPAVR